MYSDNLTANNIDSLIEQYKKNIEDLERVKKQIEDLKQLEVVIRPRDNQIFYVEYALETHPVVKVMVKVYRLPPGSSSDYFRITLDDFQKDYVEYSKKTRAVMPKL